ncbi:hypothetical protein [Ciceribacter sp. RN22]|uniref:hypothetical protein n=1 Tax=Ciceribacter sp. RN22 TaxID=2954932 RepID=UPI0020929E13|nr:hypothetical protein [Ciceribacter sp. RN22]MCO6178818.1 hypothetical protein [Ciceribacter sp. RN22]
MSRLLAQLDRRLEQRGEMVVLRRRSTAGSKIISVECEVPAIVRALTIEQLVGNVTQQTFFVILSPTHILRAQWPGGRVPATTGSLIQPAEAWIPTTSDKVVLRGRERAIERPAPIYDSGQFIRIELTATG